MEQKYQKLFENYLRHSNEKEALIKHVIQAVENSFPDQKLKILDVGCGDGSLALALKERGHQVWGVDIRNSLKNSQIDFQQTDFFQYFTDKKFDLIIMAYFIWEIPFEKWDAVFEKCKSFLEQNGKIFVIDVLNESKLDNVFLNFSLLENKQSSEINDYWERYAEQKNFHIKRTIFSSFVSARDPEELYQALLFFFQSSAFLEKYQQLKPEIFSFFKQKQAQDGKIKLKIDHVIDIIE